MSGLRLQWKAEAVAADAHLALLGLRIRETALWEYYEIQEEVWNVSGLLFFCHQYKAVWRQKRFRRDSDKPAKVYWTEASKAELRHEYKDERKM